MRMRRKTREENCKNTDKIKIKKGQLDTRELTFKNITSEKTVTNDERKIATIIFKSMQ